MDLSRISRADDTTAEQGRGRSGAGMRVGTGSKKGGPKAAQIEKARSKS
jgi:hypothetical protein